MHFFNCRHCTSYCILLLHKSDRITIELGYDPENFYEITAPLSESKKFRKLELNMHTISRNPNFLVNKSYNGII